MDSFEAGPSSKASIETLSFSEKEFDSVERYLESNENSRITVRLFLYTVTVAFEAYLAGMKGVPALVNLSPFAILVCLASMVAYSRIRHAKANAFLWVCYPQWRMHENPDIRVPDLNRKKPLDCVLECCVVYEPVLVGSICLSIALWRAYDSHGLHSGDFLVVATAGLLLLMLIIAILRRGHKYTSMVREYAKAWSKELCEEAQKREII